MKKFFVYLLCMAFTVLLLLTGLVAGVAYWAYTGPRDLGIYTQDVERSINETLKGNHVKIGSAKLAYGGIEQPIYIDVRDVVVTSDNNGTVAHLKEMQLTYGIIKLVTGNFVPSELRLVGFEVNTHDFFESGSDNSLDLKDFDLSELDRIELRKGKLNMTRLNEVWQVDHIKMKFRGDKLSVTGLMYPAAGEKVHIAAKGRYSKGDFEAVAKVENLETARFGILVPEFQGISLTIDGSLLMKLDNMDVDTIGTDITSVKGQVSNAMLRDTLSFKDGSIKSSYNLHKKTFNIDASDLHFDDNVRIRATGYKNEAGDIKAEAFIDNMHIERLYHYWPVEVGENAIAWINGHLRKGVMPTAVAKIDIKGKDMKAGTVPANAVDFNFNIVGMDVNYVEDLLPVINANGTAHMDINSLRIKVANGNLGASKISNTKVDITEIDTGKQELLRVEGDVEGSVRDIADFYLKVNKRRNKETLFQSTQDINGASKTRLIVNLPLKADLKFEQVSIDVDSMITNGTAKNDDFAARDVNANLKVNDKGWALKGAMLATLGGKNKDYNFKDIPLKVDYSKYGAPKIALDADITNSEIAIKQLGAAKPKGEKGRVEFMVSGGNINKLVIESPSIKIAGSGTLNAAMDDMKTLKLTNFEAGGSKLTADIEKADGYNVTFNAPVLNAVPILESMDSDGGASGGDPLKIKLDGKVTKMTFHHGQALNNVTLKIACSAECNNVKLDSSDLKIFQSPDKLSISSGNAGKVLKMLDAYEDMEGGKLKVEASGIKNNGYAGKVIIDDFSIQRSPVLAKVLMLGSLTGMADTLQGKGIAFKRLRGKFTRTDDALTIEDFRMFGSAIGITTEGKLNRKTNELDFQGKIIPSYTANTLLGKIPILGDIIIGDEGVFAFAYTVKGKTSDPNVFVNPLSVLAPGILQEIFQ